MRAALGGVPNFPVEIEQRIRAGRVIYVAPFLIVSARFVFALLAQMLVVLLLYARGEPYAWQSAVVHSVRHVDRAGLFALPFTPDGKSVLWRFAPIVLLGLAAALVYLRIRRLLPLILVHWAANFVSVLYLAVFPLLQRSG